MKKISILTSILSGIALCTIAQTTITLQPDAIDGKDAEVFNCVPCGYDVRNFGNKIDFNAIAWTNNGDESNVRSLIKFDLSAIPSNATITDARLTLYNSLLSSEGSHVTSFFHPNKSKLQRITTDWDESTVTWNTQPKVTKTHQVFLPATTSSHQDFLNINVTVLVQDMVAQPLHSFGFRLRLTTEVRFRKLILASSDYPDAARHPKLEITYTTPAPREGATVVPSSSKENDNIISAFEVFPNPVKNFVELSVTAEKNGAGQIQVYNLMGEKVYDQTLQLKEGKNHITLQAAVWGKGIYIVSLKSSKEIITRKLIVE